MNAGAVQRVAAGVQTQKPGALLESFGAQAGHLEQVSTAAEGAVGVPPAHHRLGHRLAQARHTGQQRHAGGVEVHAHAVDAILDHGVQAARQLALVHVVLVLAHADGLGVDLHQLGQRVLQAPRNAGRATQADVHVGHFLGSKFTGRIHRGTRLADHHLVNRPGGAGRFRVLGDEFDQVGGQLVRLAAGGAVANGDQIDAMLFTELGQGVQ